MNSILIGWLSLLAGIIGIILLVRRIVLWRLRSTARATMETKTFSEPLSLAHTILVLSDGVQSGPYTQAELKAFAVAGRFAKDAVYWEPGMPDWLPVRSLV